MDARREHNAPKLTEKSLLLTTPETDYIVLMVQAPMMTRYHEEVHITLVITKWNVLHYERRTL